MHTFDNFPQDRHCPVCGTSDNRPGVLVTDSDMEALHIANPEQEET